MRTTLLPALIVLLTILCPCYQRAIVPQNNTIQFEHKPGFRVNKTGYLTARTTALPGNTAPTNEKGSGEDSERTGTTSSDESHGSDSETEISGENPENGDEENFSSQASTTKSPQTNEHGAISPILTTNESTSPSTTAESTTITETTMIASETSTSPSTVVTPETATTYSTGDSSSSSTAAATQTTTPASTTSSKTSEPTSLPGGSGVVTGSPTTTEDDDVMTPTARAFVSKSEEEDSPFIGAIAGGIGGCVLLALVIGLVVFFVLKKKKDNKKEKTANSAQSLPMTGPTGPVPPPAATKPAFARVAKKKRPRQVQPVIVDEKHHTFMGPLTIDAGPKGPLKHGMEGIKSESIKGDLVFDDAGNKVWDIGSDVEILEKRDGESTILVDDDNTLVGSQLLQSPGSKKVDQQPKPGPTSSPVLKKI